MRVKLITRDGWSRFIDADFHNGHIMIGDLWCMHSPGQLQILQDLHPGPGSPEIRVSTFRFDNEYTSRGTPIMREL